MPGKGWIVSLRSTIVGGLIPASTNGHLTKYIESQPAQLADQLRGRESTYRLGIVVRKGGASSYCLSSIRSHPGANVMNHKLSSPFSVIVKTDLPRQGGVNLTEHQQLPHLIVLQKMWFISLIFHAISISPSAEPCAISTKYSVTLAVSASLKNI